MFNWSHIPISFTKDNFYQQSIHLTVLMQKNLHSFHNILKQLYLVLNQHSVNLCPGNISKHSISDLNSENLYEYKIQHLQSTGNSCNRSAQRLFDKSQISYFWKPATSQSINVSMKWAECVCPLPQQAKNYWKCPRIQPSLFV